MTQQAHLKKIVIVGGGTSGWIAASMLAFKLRNKLCKVELVESPDIGTIGVGEATIPNFVYLLRNLGINEQDFIVKTQSTFKLGIEFSNWREKGHSFFHPFGFYGEKIDGHEFYQCWVKSQLEGDTTPLMDYCAATRMAYEDKFSPSGMVAPDSSVHNSAYAFHFDASLVAKYLRDYALGLGVKRIEGHVSDVELKDDGGISRLLLKDNTAIEGDLFIDCSGFHSVLIEKTLGIERIDWREYLPCDRAVAVQTENIKSPVSYTRSIARDAGWSWHIPLQHRTGNGYVYSSQFCSDAEAESTLLENIESDPINNPRVIPFSAGRREEFWHKNCIAVGLSAGFIEPLESTAIHLVTRSIHFLLINFPDLDFNQDLINEYNRVLKNEYEYYRDFIILHYCTSQRTDTDFWRWCQNMPIPHSLQEKIGLFKEHGIVRMDREDELFKSESWQSIYEGMGIRPKRYDHFVDLTDYQELLMAMNKIKHKISADINPLPSHDEFIKTYCRSAP